MESPKTIDFSILFTPKMAGFSAIVGPLGHTGGCGYSVGRSGLDLGSNGAFQTLFKGQKRFGFDVQKWLSDEL